MSLFLWQIIQYPHLSNLFLDLHYLEYFQSFSIRIFTLLIQYTLILSSGFVLISVYHLPNAFKSPLLANCFAKYLQMALRLVPLKFHENIHPQIHNQIIFPIYQHYLFSWLLTQSYFPLSPCCELMKTLILWLASIFRERAFLQPFSFYPCIPTLRL